MRKQDITANAMAVSSGGSAATHKVGNVAGTKHPPHRLISIGTCVTLNSPTKGTPLWLVAKRNNLRNAAQCCVKFVKTHFSAIALRNQRKAVARSNVNVAETMTTKMVVVKQFAKLLYDNHLQRPLYGAFLHLSKCHLFIMPAPPSVPQCGHTTFSFGLRHLANVSSECFLPSIG